MGELVRSARLSAALYGGSHAAVQTQVEREAGGRVSRVASYWATGFTVVDELDREPPTRTIALRGAAWREENVNSLALWRSLNDATPIRLHDTIATVAHRGMLNLAHELYSSELEPYIAFAPPNTTIRLCGHSAGGSLALLVALVALGAGAVLASYLRVDAFGSPSVLGCEPEGEGGDALGAHGLQSCNVNWVVLGKDPIARFWIASDPFWRLVANSPLNSFINVRRPVLGRSSLFTSSRFLYEESGSVMVLEEAEDGSVSSHSLNTAASQRLSVSDFSPAMARKAIAQHSAWRYAKALECLLDAESRSENSDKDHIRGQLDLSGESGSNVLSPFIESA